MHRATDTLLREVCAPPYSPVLTMKS